MNWKKRENLSKLQFLLEKAVELDPKNVDVNKTLLGVYSALEMTAEYKALKENICFVIKKNTCLNLDRYFF
jgi:hypothetical protein